MTVEKIVRFVLQMLVYSMAAWLADLPWWQFLLVVLLILIAEKIGRTE
jgi:hypothetical protein